MLSCPIGDIRCVTMQYIVVEYRQTMLLNGLFPYRDPQFMGFDSMLDLIYEG